MQPEKKHNSNPILFIENELVIGLILRRSSVAVIIPHNEYLKMNYVKGIRESLKGKWLILSISGIYIYKNTDALLAMAPISIIKM